MAKAEKRLPLLAFHLWRVEAPHFVAGVAARDGTIYQAAPILKYALGWSVERLRTYCIEKQWSMLMVDTSEMCVPCKGTGLLEQKGQCIACAGTGINTKARMARRGALLTKLALEAGKLDDAELEHLIRMVEGMNAF